MTRSAIDATILEIAKRHLLLETLETRRSDRLDFHDLAVWNVKAALEAAYAAGAAEAASRMFGAAKPAAKATAVNSRGQKVAVTIPQD